MCGIVGYQGAFRPQLLSEMIAAVAHRGPDGEGCKVFGSREGAPPAGFGHRRLSIIDLSEQGRQPISACCARCHSGGLDDLALTYNGEIYNYRELRADLITRGHVLGTQTDSEVILHLYAEHGLNMLTMLNGIFAFAIRDGRSTGRPLGVALGDLVIARDQLGVKPLYYAALREGFLFASELKALLRYPELSREIDPIAIHQQLAYLWTPAPRTALKAVRKLPPGRACLVRNGAVVREWTYYDLPYGQPWLEGDEEAIADELRSIVAAAVRRQMVSDVPIGAFLSGGLDSSAVVALMCESGLSRALHCYCIGFSDDVGVDGSPADTPYARKVARHVGADLEEITVGADIIKRLDHVVYHLDEPHADPAPINVLIIAERAREQGIPVLLSGAGGDDIFSGYRRHRALRGERFWGLAPLAARRMIARAARTATARGLAGTSTLSRRAIKVLEHADLSDDERIASYFWWGAETTRRALYSPSFAAAVADEDTATPFLESLANIPQERDPLNRMLYLEGKHFLADHNLSYTDKMGMAAGVEIRVPLLDLQVVDFATRIPPRMKQRGRVGKSIFKRAMRRDLPRDVVYRPKSGFGAPLRRWIRDDLQELLADTLSPEAVRNRGLFDPSKVQRLIKQNTAGQVDGAYTLFALLSLEMWFRRFVDQP